MERCLWFAGTGAVVMGSSACLDGVLERHGRCEVDGTVAENVFPHSRSSWDSYDAALLDARALSVCPSVWLTD